MHWIKLTVYSSDDSHKPEIKHHVQVEHIVSYYDDLHMVCGKIGLADDDKYERICSVVEMVDGQRRCKETADQIAEMISKVMAK